jgi:hypothetical protein
MEASRQEKRGGEGSYRVVIFLLRNVHANGSGDYQVRCMKFLLFSTEV